MVSIPVSHGELIDKIIILELKSKYIKQKNKLINVHNELLILQEIYKNIDVGNVIEEIRKLRRVNLLLWKIEDKLRWKEKVKVFDGEFILLARSVYKLNDQRSQLKKTINIHTHSCIIEEKTYN